MAAAIQPAVPPPTMAMSRIWPFMLCDRAPLEISTVAHLRGARSSVLNELRVAGQSVDCSFDHRTHPQQRRPDFFDIENIRKRIVILRYHVLAQEQRKPLSRRNGSSRTW